MRKLSRCEIVVALACNFFTVLHLATIAAVAAFAPGWIWKTVGLTLTVYFLPLACVRLATAIRPLQPGRIPVGSAAYYVWWFSFCAQNLYARFPALEEALRCIPGCYSLWLRLWGAKIGKLTYWSAGVRIYDRAFVKVGDHCRFGLGVRIAPHVHVEDDLLLAPVEIEDNVVVGAYSLLVAGTVLKADQSTRAYLLSPPNSIWQDNRRIAK